LCALAPTLNSISRKDLLWVLALPLYAVLVTFRHEASHAVAGWLTGVPIDEFHVFPSITEEGFVWGYVSFAGEAGWAVLAAPYLCDALTFAVAFPVCKYLRMPHWLWLNVLILGVLAPLVNSAYNYANGFWRPANDIAKLFGRLPDAWVHGYFLMMITAYVAFIFGFLFRLQQWHASNEKI
jgi:hypothetical protein